MHGDGCNAEFTRNIHILSACPSYHHLGVIYIIVGMTACVHEKVWKRTFTLFTICCPRFIE